MKQQSLFITSRESVIQDIPKYLMEEDGVEFESETVFEDGELNETDGPEWMEKGQITNEAVSKYY